MSTVHTEWANAVECTVEAASRAEANEDWSLDGYVSAPAVVAVDGGDGCIAFVGSREDLIHFAMRLRDAVYTLPRNLPVVDLVKREES